MRKKIKIPQNVLVSLFIFLLFIVFFYVTKEKKLKEDIIISNYIQSNNIAVLNNIDIKKFSKEFYLIEGIRNYHNGNIEDAYNFFIKSLELCKEKDLSYRVYLKFFINNCELIFNGKGDINNVEFIMENLNKISILKNDIDFIWKVLIPVAEENENLKNKSILIVEKYLKNSKNMKKFTKIKLKEIIAILKLMNKKYSDSTKLFFEIIYEVDEIKNSTLLNEKNKIKIKSYEQLGNINFILENYQDAIKLYNLSLSIPLENKTEEAELKFNMYINKVTSYIELDRYDKARDILKESKKITSLLPKEIIKEFNIFFYNNLARIEIYEGNYDEAQEILEHLKNFLEKDNDNKNPNINLYIDFTYVEYYIEKKQYLEALNILDYIIKNMENDDLGFEKMVYYFKMIIYQETNHFKEYLDNSDKYMKAVEEIDLMLRKDYLESIKNGYIKEQLEKKEVKMIIQIKILIIAVLLILFWGIYQVLKIVNLKKSNFYDHLTGSYNRKYLEGIFKKIEKNKKTCEIALLMIDIDYFKNYNDTYGHMKGDLVIKKVAKVLKDSIDKKDISIRYGGEEFLIISESIKKLELICETINFNLKKENILHETSKVSNIVTVTIGGTIGVVTNKEDCLNLIRKADENLYKAKNSGRNQFNIN